MSDIIDILSPLVQSGKPQFWQGPATDSTIVELQRLLGVALPGSLRSFLSEFGGGGIAGAEISGIESNNPSLENRGTILGDTKRCREEYRLPKELIVIFYTDDGVCWCLDSARCDDSGEYPVVSYSWSSHRVDARIALTFEAFLKEYVRLQLGTNSSV